MEPHHQRRAVAADAIGALAEALLTQSDRDTFRALTKEKSKDFSADDLPLLRSFFHDPPKESPHFDTTKHGLGGWLSRCQFAIFELIYNMGEDALPFIRATAWGEYDWTQGNAIELLIRMAADGVRTEEIIQEIETKFPHIRHEASLYALQPLIDELDKDADLKRVFDRLMGIESLKAAYDELTYVDPDPYNIADERLHATVVTARATDLHEMNMRIIACLDGENIGYWDFESGGGKVRIYISNECKLVKPKQDDVEPATLDELLQSKKVAIGHYSFKSHDDDNIACIYPNSVAMLT